MFTRCHGKWGFSMVFLILVLLPLQLKGTGNELLKKRNTPNNSRFISTSLVKALQQPDKIAFIEFENNRKKFCHGDRPFEVLGITIPDDIIGRFSISGGVGLTDHNNNKATIDPGSLNPGTYTITYTVTDDVHAEADFEVGAPLIADFSWDKSCFQAGLSVTISDRSASPYGQLTDTSYYWKVYHSTSPTEFYTDRIQTQFPAAGHYAVELFIENSLGCIDSVKKVIPLNNIISVSGSSYFEDFESVSADWNSGRELQTTNNSWTLGDPAQGFSNPHSGTKMWYTQVHPALIPAEKSWISGPCFDFRGSQQLIVSAYIWRLFSNDRDGVSLQASTDNGETWTTVGNVFSGFNWYNDKYGSAQHPGWTNINDAGWIEVRHVLDDFAGKSPVQFRFFYEAGGNATGNYGFALDDFKIGRRNHKSLIEHFTNTFEPKSFSADSAVDAFSVKNNAGVIDLQYHTSTPANDPFYNDNPVVPSTRQLYYGINNVPFALINGGSRAEQRFDFSSGSRDLASGLSETLGESKFDIRTQSMITGDTLYVQTRIKALQEIPETDLALRIAVYEPLISTIIGSNGDNSFRNVVKTMLPGSAGIPLPPAWNRNDSLILTESWAMVNVYTPGNIKAVAFVQNETTHEIYQAAADTRGIFTGTSDWVGNPSDMRVYPNPASYSFHLLLPESHDETMVELINSLGRLIYSIKIHQGTRNAEIDVAELPAGIYIIRFREADRPPVHRKVIIAR